MLAHALLTGLLAASFLVAPRTANATAAGESPIVGVWREAQTPTAPTILIFKEDGTFQKSLVSEFGYGGVAEKGRYTLQGDKLVMEFESATETGPDTAPGTHPEHLVQEYKVGMPDAETLTLGWRLGGGYGSDYFEHYSRVHPPGR